MRSEQTLKSILESLDDFPWDHELYVKDAELKDSHAVALVLQDDAEVDRDSDDEPAFASSRGYQYFMPIADLQNVKDNLQQQDGCLTLEKLINAIRFYRQNDGFQTISS
ncbi:DUF7716 domain-containing protein [Marinobacter adhaerens]|jgi:hypothetical protein|uniref:DUF7716 domain-containing protein n=1 Tax=Marinobacter adhaerens TaxID=1033846 RepID=UPI001E3436F5|nr:hypothetical protein [Marinobacter adhaerens]MCD1647530.1 hypothetical protein [Marinobacter adhaerens]